MRIKLSEWTILYQYKVEVVHILKYNRTHLLGFVPLSFGILKETKKKRMELLHTKTGYIRKDGSYIQQQK